MTSGRSSIRSIRAGQEKYIERWLIAFEKREKDGCHEREAKNGCAINLLSAPAICTRPSPTIAGDFITACYLTRINFPSEGSEKRLSLLATAIAVDEWSFP
jgi:hypothetical protein